MKTLIVYAHPEPKSLNSSLKDLAVSTLEAAGHEVRVSDLYSMRWKAVVDAADFGPDASSPLKVARDSGRAFDAGTLTPDVLREQEKLLWADTIIFQFPLWWYGMPAILKAQGVGGPGVHLPLCLRGRRAQRHQVRRAFR